jgi:hypothetical protein
MVSVSIRLSQGLTFHELKRLAGELDGRVMQQVQAALRAWLGL